MKFIWPVNGKTMFVCLHEFSLYAAICFWFITNHLALNFSVDLENHSEKNPSESLLVSSDEDQEI